MSSNFISANFEISMLSDYVHISSSLESLKDDICITINEINREEEERARAAAAALALLKRK